MITWKTISNLKDAISLIGELATQNAILLETLKIARGAIEPRPYHELIDRINKAIAQAEGRE